MKDRSPILVTGVAGFIGYHTARALLNEGECVVGLDNLNDYYAVSLKRDRLARLYGGSFEFVEADMIDEPAVRGLFRKHGFGRVVHLAAQAGVRHSIDHPADYVQSNVVGFLNVLEGCRATGAEHLVYASSSSVYGLNAAMPFAEGAGASHPVSLYGATKLANEAMAHSYAHLYGLPTTGLRFFTVYGPWGRPDMAYYLFTDAILKGEPIEVFGQGQMARDFTYIDDIIDGMLALMGSRVDQAEHRLFNIGDSAPRGLMTMIDILERALGVEAKKIMKPMQPGDVTATYADISRLHAVSGYAPKVSLEEGLPRFVAWRREYGG